MKVYLDDCVLDERLEVELTRAGFELSTSLSAGIAGARDHLHLDYAAANDCLLLTKNPRDFEALHSAWRRRGKAHSGIALIYQDNVKGKDMRPSEIVSALQNLVSSGLPIANEIHTLNHWRFGPSP